MFIPKKRDVFQARVVACTGAHLEGKIIVEREVICG